MASALRDWWKDHRQRHGIWRTVGTFLAQVWQFLRDSTPERRRQRYGDVEYDWDYRVNTTSATVGWRDRLLGMFHSPYQPTDPGLFREMMSKLEIEFSEFTFIDLGAGKGRVLLMASEYPFHRILGVELLPELNRDAEKNLARYKSSTQKCFDLQVECRDARDFQFPAEPTVLYLFNPLPRPGFQLMVKNLESSLQQTPRNLYVLYHNPLLEDELAKCQGLHKIMGTHQYSIYSSQ